MEMSHRSKDFIQIAEQAEKDFRELLGVPQNYQVFFFQGGATMQFSAIPFNLTKDNKKVNYLTTGAWSEQAFKEAKKVCQPNEVWADSGSKFTTVPNPDTWKIEADAAYFHYCDNETIHGVEFNDFPFEKVAGTTLVCDMSSNIGTRPIDWEKYGVVYAGAQKNLGPAGVCVVVVREDLIGHQRPDTPILFDWKAFRDAPTKFHNTPSCWPIYVTGLNLAYMKNLGLAHFHELANKRSSMLYDYIDNSEGYYSNPVDPKYRSRTNIPFRVKKDEKLENKFLAEAQKEGLIELKGHRSVGGCRASCYNAMPIEGVEALVAFMKKFREENP
jgi:phosphoserine aminotransferase